MSAHLYYNLSIIDSSSFIFGENNTMYSLFMENLWTPFYPEISKINSKDQYTQKHINNDAVDIFSNEYLGFAIFILLYLFYCNIIWIKYRY